MKQSPLEAQSVLDVIIVGAGPAGLSTAMHLLRLDASWSRRMLVLEQAEHPRPKLCGGGLTRLGEEALEALGLTLTVPCRPAWELRSLADHFDTSLHGRPVFKLLERSRFDGWLYEEAVSRGVQGYVWHFPSLREDAPARSYGIFHSRIGWRRRKIPGRLRRGRVQLRRLLPEGPSPSDYLPPLLEAEGGGALLQPSTPPGDPPSLGSYSLGYQAPYSILPPLHSRDPAPAGGQLPAACGGESAWRRKG